MSGYTCTYDASHKVKAGGGHVTSFERHIARDADLAAGFGFGHANRNIDKARTHMNVTRVNDGAGGWRRLVSVDGRAPSAEIGDYLSERLATVKRKIRPDAVVMRPLILQLDPKWFDANNPDWRENGLNAEAWGYVQEQLDWAAWEFGQENLVAYSIHLDETSPQLQLLFTPVTRDGQLSQKRYFKGPGHLQAQHRELRDRLCRAGYDVEFKVSGRSRDRLSSREFAAGCDRVKALSAELNQRESALKPREAALDRREAELDAGLAELPTLRRRAVESGKAEGLAEARAKSSEIIASAQTRAADIQNDARQQAFAISLAAAEEAEAEKAETKRLQARLRTGTALYAEATRDVRALLNALRGVTVPQSVKRHLMDSAARSRASRQAVNDWEREHAETDEPGLGE